MLPLVEAGRCVPCSFALLPCLLLVCVLQVSWNVGLFICKVDSEDEGFCERQQHACSCKTVLPGSPDRPHLLPCMLVSPKPHTAVSSLLADYAAILDCYSLCMAQPSVRVVSASYGRQAGDVRSRSSSLDRFCHVYRSR